MNNLYVLINHGKFASTYIICDGDTGFPNLIPPIDIYNAGKKLILYISSKCIKY